MDFETERKRERERERERTACKRWIKKKGEKKMREGGRSLPGRRRYGIPLDINRASCTKGGPLLSGHFIGVPGTI